MEHKTIKTIYAVSAILALSGLAVGCSSGSTSEPSSDSATLESSSSSANSNSMIDEQLIASVECIVTDVKSQDIINIQEISATEVLLTLKAGAYFYYNEVVTVTNYTSDAEDIYVEYRLADVDGVVFDTSTFLEVVNANETFAFTDNKITEAPREIVLRGDPSQTKTWFDCPIVEAKL
jgi:hypothetical protein